MRSSNVEVPGRPSADAEWTAGLGEAFPSLRGVRLVVVGYRLWDPVQGRMQAGGTETYASVLADVARALGGDLVYLQRDRTRFAAEPRPGVAVRAWTDRAELGRLVAESRAGAPGRPWVLVLFVTDHLPAADEHPSVLLHHGILDDGRFERRPRSRLGWWWRDTRKLFVFLRRRRRALRLLEGTTRTVAVDTNVASVMRVLWPQFDLADRIRSVPNFGTLLPRAEVEAKWSGPGPLTVLFARRFVYKRGTYLWAEALASLAPRFPEVRFRCLGHGEGGAALREVAARHANVAVLERPHDEMVEEYRQAHLSVVPSLWSEGTSLSAIEGLCAGNAIVATDVGGLPDVVVPDVNGLLVPPTRAAVEAAVARLLGDRDEARRLGLVGWEMAATTFSRVAWARRICAALAEAIADPVPRPLVRRVAPHPGVE